MGGDPDHASETERAALLAEYQFVSSLIPLYREFEMQAVRLAIVILTATAVFIASSDSKDDILMALAFVPCLMALILLALSGMEVRIIRASRYVDRSLAPQFRHLAKNDAVLRWETAPRVHLAPWQVVMSGTWVYTLILLVPGGLAGLVALLKQSPRAQTWIAAVGLLLLMAGMLAVLTTSSRHEARTGD